MTSTSTSDAAEDAAKDVAEDALPDLPLEPIVAVALYHWADTNGKHVAFNPLVPSTHFDWWKRREAFDKHGCKVQQNFRRLLTAKRTIENDLQKDHLKFVAMLREAVKKAIDARTFLTDFVVNRSLLSGQAATTCALGQCATFEEGVARLRHNMAVAAHEARGDLRHGPHRFSLFNANLRNYYANVQCVGDAIEAQLAHLKRTKQRRIQEKPHGNCWLVSEAVDEDALAEILQWVAPQGLVALPATCKAMATQPTLALRKPHVSVRCLPTTFEADVQGAQQQQLHVEQKWFPHYTERRTGTTEHEVHVVCKKRAVVLLVDFAMCGSVRATPLQIDRTTRTHNVIDAATGEPSDWHESNHFERVSRRRERYDNADQCRARQASEDCHVQNGWFRKRIGTGNYFSEEIQVNEVQLLYADTLQPVPMTRGEPAVAINTLTKKATKQKLHSTYTSRDNVPYPAKVSVSVNALSSLHDDRAFVLRVCTRAFRDTSPTRGGVRGAVNMHAVTPKFKTVYKLEPVQMQSHVPP